MLTSLPLLPKILVVDDHELTRFSLRIALQHQSTVELVGMATNGREAIELVKHLHPDVIILDLQMPVLDGASTSKMIKRLDPTIKIIGYSTTQADAVQDLLASAELDAICDKSEGTNCLVNLACQLIEVNA